MPYFKYMKNRRKFNNHQRKKAIAQFFLQNFMFLKGKLLISSNLTLFNQKTWKNLQKNPKNKFFYHFQWDFEDIFQKQNCRSSIRFPNFSAVFDLEPKNHFFTYFAKIPGQTRRPRASDFDNSQFRIGTICGLALFSFSSSWDISVWKAWRQGRAGSPTESSTIFVNRTLSASLRS